MEQMARNLYVTSEPLRVCVCKNNLAVKYERASVRPATAWAQRRQFQAEDGTGPVARSSGVSLPPFVQAV